MPLTCQAGDELISSVGFSDAEWQELRKRNASTGALRLVCCGSHVTLKTSRLGTRFFAHKHIGECTSASETAEHLFVKACIARAIGQTSDWIAETEVCGHAPDGSRWIADVLAKRGATRIAFEMQWSPQTLEHTERRQAQYRASDVRGLWLFSRPSGIQVSQLVPSVLIELNLDGPSAKVYIPSESPQVHSKDHLARRDASLWGQQIELGRFVRGCLARSFVWAPGLNKRVPLELWTAEQDCWRCHNPTAIVTSLVFRVDLLVPGARTIALGVEDFDTPAATATLMDALHHVDLKAFGIGALRSRFSRTRGSSYFSNGCVHCDALQGAFYEHEVAYDARPALTVDCRMDAGIFTGEVDATPLRWAFDERFEAPP